MIRQGARHIVEKIGPLIEFEPEIPIDHPRLGRFGGADDLLQAEDVRIQVAQIGDQAVMQAAAPPVQAYDSHSQPLHGPARPFHA
jgi:hypothetical protein